MYEFNSDLGIVLSGGLRPPAECTNWVKNSLFFVVLTRYKTTTHAVFDASAKATKCYSPFIRTLCCALHASKYALSHSS